MFFAHGYGSDRPLTFALRPLDTQSLSSIDDGLQSIQADRAGDKAAGGVSEDDHLALLGVLNSSTACFWLKQVCHRRRAAAVQCGGTTAEMRER